MNKLIIICTCMLVSVLLMHGCYVNVDSSIDSDNEFGKDQIYGSNNTIVVDKDYKNFKALEFSSLVKATIIKSSEYSVSIEINDNLLPYLDCYQRGEKIFIGMKTNYNYRNVKLSVVIKTPDVEIINLAGASAVDISGFNSNGKLTVTSSGASSISGNLYVQELNFDLSGASVVNLQGGAEEIFMLASGASSIKLSSFEVEYGDFNLSGASSAFVNVTKKIDLTISGASVFKYLGNPSIGRLNISGGSVFQRIN